MTLFANFESFSRVLKTKPMKIIGCRFLCRAHVIDESFPADHPYASHIPRTALLPNFDNPANPQKGPAGELTSHGPKAPAPTIVKKKTFGNDRRHEIQKEQMPSEKIPYQYQPNKVNYYQVLSFKSWIIIIL